MAVRPAVVLRAVRAQEPEHLARRRAVRLGCVVLTALALAGAYLAWAGRAL